MEIVAPGTASLDRFVSAALVLPPSPGLKHSRSYLAAER